MSATSHRTIDHDEIREWVEERGGKPATVKRTGDKNEPGVLRIDFPGFSGEESLEEISWDDFFEKFEEAELAFVYQEETADGQPSRFSKLVRRTEEDEAGGGDGKSKGKSGSASGSKSGGASASGGASGSKSGGGSKSGSASKSASGSSSKGGSASKGKGKSEQRRKAG